MPGQQKKSNERINNGKSVKQAGYVCTHHEQNKCNNNRILAAEGITHTLLTVTLSAGVTELKT